MTLLCKCMDDTCGNQHYADTLTPRPVSEGWHSTTSGYGSMTIIATDNGPQVEGDVPDRIGCERKMLDQLVPAVGDYHPAAGTLRILDYRFRQIGVDGPEIVVFERESA